MLHLTPSGSSSVRELHYITNILNSRLYNSGIEEISLDQSVCKCYKYLKEFLRYILWIWMKGMYFLVLVALWTVKVVEVVIIKRSSISCGPISRSLIDLRVPCFHCPHFHTFQCTATETEELHPPTWFSNLGDLHRAHGPAGVTCIASTSL